VKEAVLSGLIVVAVICKSSWPDYIISGPLRQARPSIESARLRAH
jgi:hypothetical protein